MDPQGFSDYLAALGFALDNGPLVRRVGVFANHRQPLPIRAEYPGLRIGDLARVALGYAVAGFDADDMNRLLVRGY
jgi:hypothetical protein